LVFEKKGGLREISPPEQGSKFIVIGFVKSFACALPFLLDTFYADSNQLDVVKRSFSKSLKRREHVNKDLN
jgi:homospermidine synthase